MHTNKRMKIATTCGQITQTKMIQTPPTHAQEHWVSKARRFII